VELAPKAAIFAAPRHPYTEALLSAVPIPDPKLRRRDRIILAGDLPSPASPPRGCHFHTRCPRAIARCTEEAPVLRAVAAGHQAACHLAE
jgi:oligopeptide/dipeptide ABC transporter ATP-binding protein